MNLWVPGVQLDSAWLHAVLKAGVHVLMFSLKKKNFIQLLLPKPDLNFCDTELEISHEMCFWVAIRQAKTSRGIYGPISVRLLTLEGSHHSVAGAESCCKSYKSMKTNSWRLLVFMGDPFKWWRRISARPGSHSDQWTKWGPNAPDRTEEGRDSQLAAPKTRPAARRNWQLLYS